MRRYSAIFVMLLAAVLSGSAAPSADAQFGKLKDKVKQKVGQKVDEKTDQTIDKALEDPRGAGQPGETPAEGAPDEEGAVETPTGQGGTPTAEDMAPYTKYDFVPGDKVIFFDDLAGEEIGEFPSRWGLKGGVFENVKMAGQNWILCTDQGTIYPKIAPAPLPEKYTVEMEFFSDGGGHDGWYYLHWLDASDEVIGVLQIGYSNMTALKINDQELASKEIPTLARGKHVMRVMATKSTLKCYIDQERIANVPKLDAFSPVRFAVEANPYFEDNKSALIGSFRYAEGGKTLKEQLDQDGRIVTHGILFDSGSDRIKAESYKTLADIGALLTESPSLRLSIEGHTDSDGTDEANLTLSQSRANSVKTYLVDTYRIEAGRLETKGWGEGKPMAQNDSTEGKAMNRRVELVKLP